VLAKARRVCLSQSNLFADAEFEDEACGGGSPHGEAGAVAVEGTLADGAFTEYTGCVQYTIRGIPAPVDAAIRKRARAAGKSLNETIIEALAEGVGLTGAPRKRRDLGQFAGSWRGNKDVEAALAEQDRVDEELWR
jgi:hypothetical protein